MEAVELDAEQSRERMRKLRRVVRRNDAVAWARSFLDTLAAVTSPED